MTALRVRLASAWALAVLALCAPAYAQAPTVDWEGSGEAFRDAVIPIINDILPIAVGLFALFVGIQLFRKMLKQSTR